MRLEPANGPLATGHTCAQRRIRNYALDAHKLVDDMVFMGSLSTNVAYLGQVQKNSYRVILSCCFVWVWNLVHIEAGT